MRSWIFTETNYKHLLERLFKELGPGHISRAADAIGCQRSYLSQVLHTKVQLTKDQAWGLGTFFNLSPSEARYFETLVDHDRASSPAFRRHLEKELEEMRREAGRIASQFSEQTGFSESDALAYFSHWLPCAVHILSSVPEFQTAEAMAERLHVGIARIHSTLALLAERGLVEKRKNKWVFAKGTGYVPKESTYVSMHHQNWRRLADDDSRNQASDGLHYTMVQSVSRADFEALKASVLDFISRTRKIAEPSDPEELTALCLDFFRPA